MATDRGSRTARGEAQAERVVEAAFGLIAERGFEGLRTRDVALRAGINVATLHYYFPTKEDLIRGVVSAATERFRTGHGGRDADAVRDPLAVLREDLRIRQRQVEESPELFTVLLELSTRAARDPAIRAMMQETTEQWRAHVAHYLQAGVEAGVFRQDLDVAAAAAHLVALSLGWHLQMLISPDATASERFNAEVERWLIGR